MEGEQPKPNDEPTAGSSDGSAVAIVEHDEEQVLGPQKVRTRSFVVGLLRVHHLFDTALHRPRRS